ncbi:MAG: Pycsar system effector family protein [Gemmatimonadota bacterium]
MPTDLSNQQSGETQRIPDEVLINSLEMNLSRLVTTGAIADARGGFIMSINVAMLGSLAASVAGSSLLSKGIAAWLLFLAAGGFSLVSMGSVVFGAFPRVRAKGPPSLAFFHSISHMSIDDYFRRLRASSRTDYARDLADNCHQVATIVSIKFKYARIGIAMLVLAAGPWIGCLYLAGRLPIG